MYCKERFQQFFTANSGRQKHGQNPNSSVVAETEKLLFISSYSYQIMDRSRHTVTKHYSDWKTHADFTIQFFEKLDHVNNSLYEVELAKAECEHEERFILGFVILLELNYKFFTRFCDANFSEELFMYTDSHDLDLAVT